LLARIDALPSDVGFVAVVDSEEPPSRISYEIFENYLPTRGRILAWQERNGPSELEEALRAIIETQVR